MCDKTADADTMSGTRVSEYINVSKFVFSYSNNSRENVDRFTKKQRDSERLS